MKKLFLILLSFIILLGPSPLLAKPDKTLSKVPYEELDLFTKILHHIQNSYVEEIQDKEVLYGAIEGMMSSLDPHSSFLKPEYYKELKVDTEGKFGGIGIEITIRDKVLTVVSPIEGTPADRAGIREGDKILRIGTTSTKGMSLTEAVKLMRGKRGTKIRLTLKRGEEKKSFKVILKRDTIKIRSVRSEWLEENYGYVRISSFQEGTSKELFKTLSKLSQKEGMKGLILDLRNNPGGLLEEAIAVADRFLKKGTIVATRSRNQEVDKRQAKPDGNEPDYPIIILINGGSASAAEIVAGALQDHKKAILLGTTSFGKGSVQTIYELGKGAALKLTVARYYTPSGRSIQAEGIQPDIIVSRPEEASSISMTDRYVREKDLKGHLEGEDNGKKKTRKKNSKSTKESKSVDFQKAAALNYLKSWDVFGKPVTAEPS